jgi:RNA polymerase sigma factor (sigma-70 family)
LTDFQGIMHRHEPVDNPGPQDRPPGPVPEANPGTVEQRLRDVEDAVRGAVDGFLAAGDPDHEDMVQLALIGTTRYLADVEDVNGHPGSGLGRLAAAIARNRCRDLLRRRKVRGEVQLEPFESILAAPCPTVLEEMEQAEQIEFLVRAVHELPARCRRLLESGYLEGASVGAILTGFGFNSPQSYYYHRNKCLEQLRSVFNRWFA